MPARGGRPSGTGQAPRVWTPPVHRGDETRRRRPVVGPRSGAVTGQQGTAARSRLKKAVGSGDARDRPLAVEQLHPTHRSPRRRVSPHRKPVGRNGCADLTGSSTITADGRLLLARVDCVPVGRAPELAPSKSSQREFAAAQPVVSAQPLVSRATASRAPRKSSTAKSIQPKCDLRLAVNDLPRKVTDRRCGRQWLTGRPRWRWPSPAAVRPARTGKPQAGDAPPASLPQHRRCPDAVCWQPRPCAGVLRRRAFALPRGGSRRQAETSPPIPHKRNRIRKPPATGG